MLLSASWDSVRFSWLNGVALDREFNPAAIGRKSGVLCAESMGLAPLRSGVEVRESALSRGKPLGTLTAANELGVEGCAEGVCDNCAFTAVKPPELTGVNPEEIAGRGNSAGGVGTESP